MKKIAAFGFALLMVLAVFVPVVSALNDPTKEGYQSVVNPNPAGEKSPENIGHLDVLLACRAPQIGGEFTIVPVAVSAPFTNAARVDKGFVDQFVKQFGEPKTEQYLPDGTFDSNYAPGTYLLKQIDGNGGQPEFALVTLKVACAETVVFLGHGITPATVEEPQPVIVITEAKYGEFRTEVDVAAHTEHETDTVVDVAEHFEHVTDTVVDVAEHTVTVPATFKEVPCTHFVAATYKQVPCTHYDAGVAAHYEHANDPAEVPCTHEATVTYTIVHDHDAHTGHANKVYGNAQYSFTIGNQKYQITSNSHDDAYLRTVTSYQHPHDDITVPCTHYDAGIAPHFEHVTDTVVDVAEHFEHVTDTVVDVPEHTETVAATFKEVPCTHFVAETTKQVPCTHNVAATYKTVGYFVDVKAQVQADIDAGVQNIVFNNAANPGGIFDTEGHLLNQLADPLYGTLKTATIKYTVDGGAEKTVSGQEHQTISIV